MARKLWRSSSSARRKVSFLCKLPHYARLPYPRDEKVSFKKKINLFQRASPSCQIFAANKGCAKRTSTHTPPDYPTGSTRTASPPPNSSTAVKRRTTPPVPALSSIMCPCWAPIGHAPSAALNAGRLQRAGMPGFLDAFTGTPEYLPAFVRCRDLDGQRLGCVFPGCVPEMRSTYRIAREG
jgi:hypothetical protein